MNRRRFLTISGSTAVILAAGGLGFVATRTPTEALKPWAMAGSLYSDPMRNALSYAILAPNPHNRQPWTVALTSDTEAVLTCDLDRLLPVTDPFSRQIVIGLGCFLELFAIAANQQGYRADIAVFPDGEPGQILDSRPVAHLTLRPEDGLAADPLFAHILDRHTNREPYDTGRTIGDALLGRLAAMAPGPVEVGTTNGGAVLAGLRNLTREAMQTEIRNPEAFQESIDLMRIGRAQIEANPDGIALGGPFLESLSLLGILTHKSLANPQSQSFQIGLDMAAAAANSAMGFLWINTSENDRKAQIDTGRAYMRIALHAMVEGLSLQPMSQALQEYPAMAPYFKRAHDMLTSQGQPHTQMLVRLGFANKSGLSPRWPLETRLKET